MVLRVACLHPHRLGDSLVFEGTVDAGQPPELFMVQYASAVIQWKAAGVALRVTVRLSPLVCVCVCELSFGGNNQRVMGGGTAKQKVANRYGRDFGCEIAHAAVSRRPPISLSRTVARTRMCT
jgi:hypothetical protein